jgi:hypothetical protein
MKTVGYLRQVCQIKMANAIELKCKLTDYEEYIIF